MYCISKILAVTFLVGGGVCAGVCVGGGGSRPQLESSFGKIFFRIDGVL